jgi:hypothetical protein
LGRQLPGEICGFPVFVKRLPLTDEEKERPDDTSNIFGLPNFYHYGVGSAGFGAFREVAGHLKATDWVLDGAIESFPLLYQRRVIPRPEARFGPLPSLSVAGPVEECAVTECCSALAVSPSAGTAGAPVKARRRSRGRNCDVGYSASAKERVGDG